VLLLVKSHKVVYENLNYSFAANLILYFLTPKCKVSHSFYYDLKQKTTSRDQTEQKKEQYVE